MFFKELENGKVRFFEKFYNVKELKWQQVTVTMPSKTRAMQAEAKRQLAHKIEKIQSASMPQSLANFSEVFVEWQGIRQKELKASSYFCETAGLKKFVQRFGSVKIATITSSELQAFFASITRVPQSMANLRCQIDLFFRFALKRGYIAENPMAGVVLAKRKLSEERLVQDKKKYLTHDEVMAVLEVIPNPRLAWCLEFLFLTGLRVGELLALRFEDYDGEAKKLHIHHTLNYTGHSVNARVLQSPKTVHSYRTIALDQRSLAILDYFTVSNADPQFIFTLKNGKTPSRAMLGEVLKTACAKALKLPQEQAPTLHGLRHSHISLLAELGVPMKACIERVGHADEKMILRIYAHVTPRMEDELIAKINQKLTNAGA